MHIKKCILSATIYCGLALIGLQFAAPPGYASPMWPAAGAALGLAIHWGRPAGIGVAIGSAIANKLGNPADPILMDALLGIGAGLQAWVGTVLVTRFANGGLMLARIDKVLIFFFLGGPVACLINAINGPFWLLQFGILDTGMFWSNFWFWWIGDALGSIVVAPIVVSLLHPSPVWRPRSKMIVPIQTLTLIFHAVLYLVVRDVVFSEITLDGFGVWLIGTGLSISIAVLSVMLMLITIRTADIGHSISNGRMVHGERRL